MSPQTKTRSLAMIPWLALIITLSLTLLITLETRHTLQEKAQNLFEQEVQKIRQSILERIENYHALLRGGRGLFAASNFVDRDEWAQFVNALNIEQNYPGILGLGFAKRVLHDDKQSFIKMAQKEIDAGYKIWPENDRADYFPILYIEPPAKNGKALGYDLGSELNRRNAAELARDSNQGQITGKIILVQNNDASQPAFLFFVPIYANGQPRDTPQQRIQNLEGWVYGAFLVNDLMKDVLPEQNALIDIEIFDGEPPSAQNLLYDDDKELHATDKKYRPSFSRTSFIEVGKHKWLLYINTKPTFDNLFDQNRVTIVAGGGLLTSFLLFGFLLVVLTTRRRAFEMAEKMTVELKEMAGLRKAILDGANYSIISTSPTGIIRSFNASAERMLGYRAIDVIGKLTPAFIHDPAEVALRAEELNKELDYEIRPGFEVFVAKARTGQVDEREWTYIRKDGSRFPVRLSVTAIRDVDDDIRGFVGIAADISENKKNSHYIELQNDIIKNMAATDDIDLLIPTVLKLISEKMEWEMGAFWSEDATHNELKCRHYWAVEVPDMMDFIESTRTISFANHIGLPGRIWASKEPAFIRDVDTDKNFPRAPHALKAGLKCAFGFPIYSDEKFIGVFEFFVKNEVILDPFLVNFFVSLGRQIGMVLIRRQAQEKLRLSEARMQAILSNTLDGIITIDDKGIIESFNASAEKIFGYKAGEIIGQNVAILVSPTDSSGKKQPGSKPKKLSIQNITGFTRELVGLKKDGSTFPMDLGMSEMILGNRKMFTGVLRDITDRKKIDLMKNEFVSTVSHELRTPLTSIRGSLGLIAGGAAGALPDKAQPLIQIALSNCDRLVRLINDILDIEKIESGKMDFTLKQSNIIDVIKSTVKANEAYAEQYGINLCLENDLESCVISIDIDRITQVITNLISNAVKFSNKDGSVVIKTSLKSKKFRLSIIDQGRGIPDEFKSKIFGKFAQADSSDTRQKGGTGLGLNICKAIVEKLGGSIGFESTMGEGSTFYFDLSVKSSPQKISNESKSNWAPRFLVCEDDADIATVIALQLEQEGFAVDVAPNAATAKQLVKKHKYIGMTLDIMLPDQDGFSLLAELRKDEKTAKLPVIVISAKEFSTKSKRKQELSLHIDNWISKPIEPTKLIESVMQIINSRDISNLRVLYIEDDEDLAKIVGEVLKDTAVLDIAKTCTEAGLKISNGQYNLILLDLNLPDGSGLSLLTAIHKQCPKAQIVIFSEMEMAFSYSDKVAAVLLKSKTSNDSLKKTVQLLLAENL